MIKVDTSAGQHIDSAISHALGVAKSKSDTACFEFNGVTIKVSATSQPDRIKRDLETAYLLDWKEMGPDYPEVYSEALQHQIREATLVRDKERQEAAAVREQKDLEERERFATLTSGVEFKVTNEAEYNSWRDKNRGGYSNACFEFAEGWAKLMKAEIDKGVPLSECAEKCSYQLGFLGISGAQYGAARSILIQCWEHGGELKKLQEEGTLT